MPADRPDSLVGVIREGVVDAELAALVWLLAEGGIPIHVAGSDGTLIRRVVGALEAVVGEVGVVAGRSLEDVLGVTSGDPARLGVVLVLDRDRVVAAHYVRPPLRDAGGHVRAQGPAVLATWEPGPATFEHFAWGVIPELAERARLRPGDFEIEHDQRREFLAGLVAAGIVDASAVRAALGGYRAADEAAHLH